MSGVDPGPFTLRELAWMADGRERSQWWRTASLLALTYNLQRDPKQSVAREPAWFHPLIRRRRKGSGIRITADSIHVLKALLPQDASRGKAPPA